MSAPAAPPPSRPRPFGTVLTAMATPFTAEGELDLDAAQRLAAHLVDAGNDGLVVAGTTGESPTLAEREHDALLAAVVEAVGDRATVVAGSGNNDTAHSVARARAAEATGVHGLLVVSPYYNKPPQEGLRRHFEAVADATGLPVMLYDIPGRTAVAIATDTLLRLAEHPRIVAVKDAKADLFASSVVMAGCDLAYYSGDDTLNLAHLTQGAVGMVSVVGHVAAAQYAQMAAAVDAGDLATALALHRRLLPAVTAIMTRTQGAIMVKAALQLQGTLAHRTVRLPLVEATPSQVEQLRADLEEAGVL
ncbi:4-hydroxy-tetrahydrodipicolinate synthase [Quadrisphaera sp. DSM 44207]|uniref:4-hydroxy-tetrahydrodipicolinate synthase n=1 Tax=Quadrisphaera sp. DSM 44207 TaxID=1881057 RepID=UPI000B89361E|nr:4-hydroxy-tetrahydrodipicolinate synthase [Quadrisphaera sp. DSM 44207]